MPSQYLGPTLGASIETPEIVDGAVTEPKLSVDAVSETKIQNLAISTDKIKLLNITPDLLEKTYIERSRGEAYDFMQLKAPTEFKFWSGEVPIYISPYGTLYLDNNKPAESTIVSIRSKSVDQTSVLRVEYGKDSGKYLELTHNSVDSIIHSVVGDLRLISRGSAVVIQNDIAAGATTFLQVFGKDADSRGEIRAEYGIDGTKNIRMYHDDSHAYITNVDGWIRIMPDEDVVIVQNKPTGDIWSTLRLIGKDEVSNGLLEIFHGTGGSDFLSLYHDGTNGRIISNMGNIQLEPHSEKVDIKRFIELWAAPLPDPAVQGQIVWTGSHFYGCLTSGSPGVWKQLDNL